MKVVIDTAEQTLTQQSGGAETTVGLFTKEAFETLSLAWVRVGWSLQYYHNFTWFGLPVLQLPEDLLRLQEVMYALRPAVIVETGVYQGGSLLFHASLLAAMGEGKVIGIDREIPQPTREALHRHTLAPRISLLEGDSTDSKIVAQVASLIRSASPVLVILDSGHARCRNGKPTIPSRPRMNLQRGIPNSASSSRLGLRIRAYSLKTLRIGRAPGWSA